MAEINIGVESSGELPDDQNIDQPNNEVNELIKAAELSAKVVEKNQEVIDKQSAQLEDMLISAEEELTAVTPKLTADQKEALKKKKKVAQIPMGDGVLAQRIENMARTIESKEFRNYETQLRPFFDNLREKASKEETVEDVNSLIENEVTKQIANISDVETSLFNSIDMMLAQIDVKIVNLEAKLAEVGIDPQSHPAIVQYEQFSERLNDMRSSVSDYISASVDKIKAEAVDYATIGFDEGTTDRMIKNAEKEQKDTEKLVTQFNKEFNKYVEKQKEIIAKTYAFDVAQNYLNTASDAKMNIAKRIYENARQDFEQNVPTPTHSFTDEEIVAMYAASGGKIDVQSVSPQVNVPSNFATSGVTAQANVPSPKITVTPPPNGNPPAPPDYNNYSNQPPNNNSSNLQLPPPQDPGNKIAKIPIHMLMTEITQAIIQPLMMIKDTATLAATSSMKSFAQASSPSRVTPQEIVKSSSNFVQQSVSTVNTIGGAAIGAGVGAMAGGVGALPGMFVGAGLGNAVGQMMPYATTGEMVSLLYDIAQNTSQQVEAFSPEILQSNIDKQLSFLEMNIDIGRQMGADLAQLNDATTELQLTFYKEALNLLRPFLPLLIGIAKTLTDLLAYVSTAIQILGLLKAAGSPFWGSLFRRGADEMVKNKQPKNKTIIPQMDQLEDNVPFLP